MHGSGEWAGAPSIKKRAWEKHSLGVVTWGNGGSISGDLQMNLERGQRWALWTVES